MTPRAKRWLAWATPERRKYTPLFLLRAYALDWYAILALCGLMSADHPSFQARVHRARVSILALDSIMFH